MECSFSIIRRIPDIAALSSKACHPKKPIRYSSISKLIKTNTINDIGNLLLQRAKKAKDSHHLLTGEVALKTDTKTASNSMAAAGPTSANLNTVAGKKPGIKTVLTIQQ
ncbi:hypothetical protein HF521_012884 [Silurus meridionalis]|uniref:Uncharacterized protein n=1 Tax=Silurus meridionalis TaxID=175797 RepID=A0A8T0ADW5_SILME|nr:hypothetical protein HF521_012884 [Silurus meridionalis]